MTALALQAKPKKGDVAAKPALRSAPSLARIPTPASQPASGQQAMGAFYAAAPALALGMPVQVKLAVGQANDPYEQEADSVAERVVQGAPAPEISAIPAGGLVAPPIQQQSDEAVVEEPVQTQPIQRLATDGSDDDNPIQTKCEHCANEGSPHEKGIQTKAEQDSSEDAIVQTHGEAAQSAAPAIAAPPVAENAVRSGSPGSAMALPTRQRIESSFGQDLSMVRVHEDNTAHHANAALKSRAFTHGNHIWLGKGESQHDLGLMAHETTHVMQQGAVIRRKLQEPENRVVPPAQNITPPASVPSAPSSPTPALANQPSVTSQQNAAAPASQEVPQRGGRARVESVAPAASDVTVAEMPSLAAGLGPELLMPEPPDGLSTTDQERLSTTQRQASEAAAVTEQMPSADETVAESRAAVQEPEAETAARAAGDLTATLSERAAPSPEIEELCERIKTLIRSQRPPDEESLVQFDPQEAAQSAGNELNASVQDDAQRVEDEYSSLQEQPQGSPQQQEQPLETPAGQVETPAVNASQAVPDAVPAENVSLDADVAAQGQRIQDSGMASEPASLINDPDNPVVQAREAEGELGAVAQQEPAEVMAEQTAVREQARGEMQSLQQQALQALQTSRRNTASGVGGRMADLGTTEEEMRTNAGNEAQRIFNDAQSRVNALLDPLPQTALQRWESGIQVLSTRVEQQSAQFNRWKQERYEGIGGTALQVVEYFTGLPDWAIDWLNRIEESFGNDVCDLIREISTEVNSVIATCEEIIDDANRQIDDLFARLPASLQGWAAGQRAGFASQLEVLHNRATSTRNDFNRQLTQQAAQSVQQVRESIHTMRQEAQGLVGQIAAAIERFIDDPARFIINGLLKLVGIQPGAFWGLVDRIGQVINDIADDPLGFANNLATALGQGFQRFFDNFKTHAVGGFFEWLFSGLGAVGVQIPSDFSLNSLITFFLQLMGITWDRIRQILARHIGEENVALLEKAYELISTLMERGVDGIFEMIKEQLNPQAILDAVLSAAVDFMVEALIRAVTPRVIAMFNPAGAVVQAIEVIYRILAWIFENAARIFSLVETVVNGAAQLIAGNTSGMATAVEGALARLVAPVIDFLAGFLGLGNLPEQIANTIRGFQEMVLGVIDRVVGWLAERARGLLRALGLGRDDDEEEDLTDHTTVANRVKRDLQSMEGIEGDYDHVRIAKEQQATELETHYSAVLEEGIGLHINFSPDNSDEQDHDIDFEIIIAPNTTSVSGSVPVADEDLELSKLEFGDRLFARQELIDNGFDAATATKHIQDWTNNGDLHALQPRGRRDPYTTIPLYSFNASKTDTLRYAGRRAEYGYRNPDKASEVGLRILCKSLVNSPPSGISIFDPNWHKNHAVYRSHTGSTFGFAVAILGHDNSTGGASGHWNQVGHMQTESQNFDWNRSSGNYSGAELNVESSQTGASSQFYRIPAKYYNSNEMWW